MSYILRRCLLFQPNPMLLAEVISKCEAPIDASIKEYAAYLTQTPKELQSKTQSTATEERVQTQVLPGLFARDPVLQTLRKFGHDASVIGDHDGGDHDQEEALSAMCKYSGANLIVALRALFHLLVVADSAGDQLGQEQQQKRLQHRFSTVACIFVQKVRNGEIPDGIVADDFLYRMIANIDSNQKLVIMMLTASQAAHGTDRLGNDVSRRLHTRESGQGKAPDLDDTLMENILVAKIVLPHVPPESAIAIKVALAKLSAGASASLGELVELTLNEASYDESHILPSPRAAAPAARTTALSLELTADVFNTWWSMACDSKEQSRTFATHLTQLVSSNACSNDDHSSTVMALLVRKPADVFAKCCLGCAKNSNIKVVDDLLRIIRAVSDFDGGYLQDTAVGIATKTHPDSFTRWQQYVHNYIAARMKARVDDASQAQEEEQQLLVRQQRQQSFNFFLLQLCATDSMDEAEVLLHVIEELVTNALPDHYPDDLWDRLGDILNHQADMTIGPRQIDVGIRTMKLATTIMHAISKTESSDPSIVSAQSLSTSLLHGACRYMLRVRKQKNRLMKKFDEFDVDGALSNIMLVICDIAQNRLSHRHTTPERDTAALLFTQVVRRVLKDGIVANAGEVQTLCLKVARLVVCDFHNTTADKTTGLVHEMDTSDDNGQTLESSDIFEMIVSHSQFAEAFSNESASNDYTTEMMKLIICCYSTAASKPTVDAEVWAVLAKPFRAGTTLYDQLFREFYIQNRNNADGKVRALL
uniref:Uncharacterized protein n=1 Tax=Craspedostauros australis TaxID=1486917 RepID=A0A7R9ZR07_9STRA